MTHPTTRGAALTALALAALHAGAQAVDPSAPAAEQAAAVCSGRVKSEALVAEALARARAAAAHNAFVHLDEAGALAAARAADAKAARAKGKGCAPLLGVPVVVKDNIHVAGMPATGGTPALKGRVPKVDAPVVARLRQAGAIVIGKTQLHELAFGISGWNSAFTTGPEPGVRNAYDRSRASGGSSAGTGVASGCGWWALVWAPTPAGRCASPVPSTAAPRCAPRSGAIRARASSPSRAPATRLGRWQ